MKIYLVENVEDESEITILDIFTNRELAIKYRDRYRNNFEDLGYENADDIITVEIVDVQPNDEEAIWSFEVEETDDENRIYL